MGGRAVLAAECQNHSSAAELQRTVDAIADAAVTDPTSVATKAKYASTLWACKEQLSCKYSSRQRIYHSRGRNTVNSCRRPQQQHEWLQRAALDGAYRSDHTTCIRERRLIFTSQLPGTASWVHSSRWPN